jgi:uncharacterized membrane protein YjjP (DUF1212 family)
MQLLSLSAQTDVASKEELALISLAARLLFENGESTEEVIFSVEKLAHALGFSVSAFLRWDELTIRFNGDSGGSHLEIIAVAPTGVDMHKVSETMKVIDRACDRSCLNVEAALAELEAISQSPPITVARFALLAAAGAVALAVIFGAVHLRSLLLISVSAGAGACLRRWLAGITPNLFVQPLCAALLAGAIGAIAVRLQLSSTLRLVAVCPCMVLIPGPHLLNGTIDLARARISLGTARIVYASTIVLMICTGLLIGLSLGGTSLPVSVPSSPVPFGYDVIAAGVAVAAYGTFFAMSWSMLPVPIIVGMLAHAARWWMISAGASVETATLFACLVAGIMVTPIVDRLRMPFAAFAFASIVSLMPGVFLFRMASGFIDLIASSGKASVAVLLGTIADGTTAILIILAMTFGLIVPKMCIEDFRLDQARASPRGPRENSRV